MSPEQAQADVIDILSGVGAVSIDCSCLTRPIYDQVQRECVIQ